MALKQLMLSKQAEQIRKELEDLNKMESDLLIREKAAEESIAEIDPKAEDYENQMSTVEEEVEEIDSEKEELNTNKTKLQGDLAEIEAEIEQLNSKIDDEAKRSKTPAAVNAGENKRKEGGNTYMKRRTAFFGGLSREQALDLVRSDESQKFLEDVRSRIGQERAITNAELTIPDEFLDLLRDNLHKYSKLVSYVNLKTLGGKGRQNVMGAIPEGVWTEAAGALNELALSMSQVEVDGYKVGGYIPVANSIIEDSELNLANEILYMLAQAIGLALDKAIVYGSGTKMPTGIATRLAQTSAPASWGSYRAAWTDLHTSNVTNFDPSSMSATEFFQALMTKLSIPQGNYSAGEKVHLMNENTWNAIKVQAISVNSAGVLVTINENKMPLVGGDVIILPFISDNDIVSGYLDLYLLAERAGSAFASDPSVRFLDDQTVFKGTARYDGQPVFGEAFVIVNINNAAPTTSKSFAVDAANKVATPTSLPIGGSYVGSQDIFLFCSTIGASIYYTVDGSTPTAESTQFTAPFAVAETTTVKAIAIKDGLDNSDVLSATFTIS